jgi:hypothetical protein
MRGVPERVARSSAPLTSSQVHKTPIFARLDLLKSSSSERRSIDVTASFARTVSKMIAQYLGGAGKPDAAPIAGAPVLVLMKRLGRAGRLSSAGG